MNVTRDELNEALRSRITHLVYPLNTVLDESIGSVLWFGAQGRGHVDGVEYSSNCRVSETLNLNLIDSFDFYMKNEDLSKTLS